MTRARIVVLAFVLVPAQAGADTVDDLLRKMARATAAKDFDQALSYAEQALQIDRANGRAYFYRGLTYGFKGDWDKAISDLSQALRHDTSLSAKVFECRGFAYMNKQDWFSALKDLDEAIKLEPKNADTVSLRGMVRGFCGQTEAGIADFTQAISLESKNTSHFTHRGILYLREGDLGRAASDFKQAFTLDPKDSVALTWRGIVFAARKEYVQAAADFKVAIGLNSNESAPHHYLAWLYATCPDEKLRDGKQALEQARRACELTKWKNPVPMLGLAAAYAEVGEFEEAVKWQKAGLEIGVDRLSFGAIKFSTAQYHVVFGPIMFSTIQSGANGGLDPTLRIKAEAQLKLYEEKKPYREQ